MVIREALKEYIENTIFEVYNLNESGHGIEHIKYVIRRSLKFAEKISDINYEMVYVIAAYHDIGHHIDAKNHEIISGKMLMEDKKINEFFSTDQMIVMKEAIEDHRSSKKTEPRTIYGKIVSSADRNTDVDTTLRRCLSYNKKHSPKLSQEELIEKCRLFLKEKYGINGYAREKIYFEDNDYLKYLDDMTELTNDKIKFSKQMKKLEI